MAFSLRDHGEDGEELQALAYAIARELSVVLPAARPIFGTAEVHVVRHGELRGTLTALTAAIPLWISDGWLEDDAGSVSYGKRIPRAWLVRAARHLRDAVEEQTARGRDLWVG